MKKRKPPIILVTGLILLAGAVVAFNYAASASQDPNQQPKAQAPNVSGSQADAKRPATNTAAGEAGQVANQMKGMPATGGPGAAGPRGATSQAGMGPMARPSIAMPKMDTNYRPKPNESATSSQWYSKETAKGSQ